MTVDASQKANILQTVKQKLGKPYEDLEFLLECLKEVLIESGEKKLAKDINNGSRQCVWSALSPCCA